MSHITTYNPQPVSFTHGEGIWLWDEDGNQYLDALSGIAVTGLGHAHPAVTEAIVSQAQKVIHTSNIYTIEKQRQLADKLTRAAGMDQVFFCNSGAEANEAAIKLARLYGHQREIENPMTIVMQGAFHGRTMATLTASGSRKVQAGFEPLVPGFIRAPYNDLDALQKIAESRNDVVAILVEPIQGEGGINVAEEHYLKGIRELCDQQQWLMMLDEVQTGIGRTGSLFAYQQLGITPDVLALAKGLGNGFPIGACLMSGLAKDIFQPGNHGSTFGGNPLACNVALAVLETIEKEKLSEHAKKMGELLQLQLEAKFANHPHVTDIRGHGLMMGVELDEPCRPMLPLGLKHGLLFSITAMQVIRLLPPLIINKENVEDIVERLALCIDEYYAGR